MRAQTDPHAPGFAAAARSRLVANTTARNWTPIGLPGRPEIALVDPHGLVTPRYPGPSLDAWVQADGGPLLAAAREPPGAIRQRLQGRLPVVATAFEHGSLRLATEAWVAVPDPAGDARLGRRAGGRLQPVGRPGHGLVLLRAAAVRAGGPGPDPADPLPRRGLQRRCAHGGRAAAGAARLGLRPRRPGRPGGAAAGAARPPRGGQRGRPLPGRRGLALRHRAVGGGRVPGFPAPRRRARVPRPRRPLRRRRGPTRCSRARARPPGRHVWTRARS